MTQIGPLLQRRRLVTIAAYLARVTWFGQRLLSYMDDPGDAGISVGTRAVNVSVLKRGNSKNWYVQFQFKGRTYIRSSRTTEKKLAEQMEREWKRQLHAQEFLGQKERVRIKKILNSYVRSKKGTPNYSNLLGHANTLCRQIDVSRYLDEMTSEELERLKSNRLSAGRSPATVKHLFNLIRGTCKYGKSMGYQVSDIVFPTIQLPKPRLRYLSVDEESRLLRELNPLREGRGIPPLTQRSDEMKQAMQDAYDLVMVLLDTGARYSEIANIEWSRIDLEEETIRLWRPKVQNESILYMTRRVREVLKRRNENSSGEFVFTNKAGGPRGYASQSIRKAMKRAGLEDCTIHTLRHTHASRLIQNGMSVYEVKEILGHSDIKTTMRYAHLEKRDVSSKARNVIDSFHKNAKRPQLKIV